MKPQVEELDRRTAGLDTEAFLRHMLSQFGDRVALASSLGAEDQVLTDMLCRAGRTPRIFTLDTGRLPQETHDVIEAVNERYGIRVKVLFPQNQKVEAMVAEHGPNLFYGSVEARKLCCRVRKVLPLARELAGLDAWITGLRRQQSAARADLHRVEWDQANSLIKLNPLIDWTTEQVWDYIRQHGVPYNKLHDLGYPSIGCAPCTRAVAPGQDIRSGRWWWEQPQHKECGLHVVDGKLTRWGAERNS